MYKGKTFHNGKKYADEFRARWNRARHINLAKEFLLLGVPLSILVIATFLLKAV